MVDGLAEARDYRAHTKGVFRAGASPNPPSGRKSPSAGGGKRKKQLSAAASEAFGAEEEEEVVETRKKRKLVPLEEDEKHMNTEEKRKHIKSLIDRIPTSKEELFNFNFDRSLVDNVSKYFIWGNTSRSVKIRPSWHGQVLHAWNGWTCCSLWACPFELGGVTCHHGRSSASRDGRLGEFGISLIVPVTDPSPDAVRQREERNPRVSSRT